MDEPSVENLRSGDHALAESLTRFRFTDAAGHLTYEHPEQVQETVEALTATFGNVGRELAGSQLGMVVTAAVWWLVEELEQLNRSDAVLDPADVKLHDLIARGDSALAADLREQVDTEASLAQLKREVAQE